MYDYQKFEIANSIERAKTLYLFFTDISLNFVILTQSASNFNRFHKKASKFTETLSV